MPLLTTKRTSSSSTFKGEEVISFQVTINYKNACYVGIHTERIAEFVMPLTTFVGDCTFPIDRTTFECIKKDDDMMKNIGEMFLKLFDEKISGIEEIKANLAENEFGAEPVSFYIERKNSTINVIVRYYKNATIEEIRSYIERSLGYSAKTKKRDLF
jgi:hypothetical protein